MAVDELTVDELTVDNLTLDELTWYQHRGSIHAFHPAVTGSNLDAPNFCGCIFGHDPPRKGAAYKKVRRQI